MIGAGIDATGTGVTVGAGAVTIGAIMGECAGVASTPAIALPAVCCYA